MPEQAMGYPKVDRQQLLRSCDKMSVKWWWKHIACSFMRANKENRAPYIFLKFWKSIQEMHLKWTKKTVFLWVISARKRLHPEIVWEVTLNVDQSFFLFLCYELIIAGIICLWHSSNEGWFMQKDFKTFDEVKYSLLSRSVSLYVGDP